MTARSDDPHDEGVPAKGTPIEARVHAGGERADAQAVGSTAAPHAEPGAQTPLMSPQTHNHGLPARSGATQTGIGDGHLHKTGADPRVGQVLGGLYELERVIGQGGMGTVYAAKHIHLQKRFAIKLLAAGQTPSEHAVARLKQEAIAASSIRHDNIVDVVSLDLLPDGSVFIVMELLEGESLAELIERGPVPVTLAVVIAVQVARALGAAHSKGILHRDLKPENVFLQSRAKDSAPRAKVLDFGISKIQSAEAEKVRLTRSGQLVGTPRYMSPEQAKGDESLDRRADVYGLGVILFEMLTGKPPFEAENYFQLLWKHGHEAPPRLSSVSETHLPSALEEVVHRALSKSPDERFDDMAAFEGALREAVNDDALEALRAAGLATALTPVNPEGQLEPVSEQARPRPRVADPLDRGRRSRRLLGLSILAGTLIALGAVALISNLEGRHNPPVAQDHAANTRAPIQPSPPREAAPPRNAPNEAQISMQFDSTPPGASVHIGEVTLGETPLVAPVPADSAALDVVFKREGYQNYQVRVVVAPGSQVHARMTRAKRPAKAPRLPIKTDF